MQHTESPTINLKLIQTPSPDNNRCNVHNPSVAQYFDKNFLATHTVLLVAVYQVVSGSTRVSLTCPEAPLEVESVKPSFSAGCIGPVFVSPSSSHHSLTMRGSVFLSPSVTEPGNSKSFVGLK